MTLSIYHKTVEKKTTTKLLGVYIDETMSWDNQIWYNITEVQNGLRMLYKISSLTKLSRTIAVYRSLVELYFDYNCSPPVTHSRRPPLYGIIVLVVNACR